ncbi:hypothetical protein BSKO_07290 [Bryopsis sp. KO-2023]|nr:hypothetical protein BSKO_07290 [Bryopsis sp. KO-2023]
MLREQLWKSQKVRRRLNNVSQRPQGIGERNTRRTQSSENIVVQHRTRFRERRRSKSVLEVSDNSINGRSSRPTHKDVPPPTATTQSPADSGRSTAELQGGCSSSASQSSGDDYMEIQVDMAVHTRNERTLELSPETTPEGVSPRGHGGDEHGAVATSSEPRMHRAFTDITNRIATSADSCKSPLRESPFLRPTHLLDITRHIRGCCEEILTISRSATANLEDCRLAARFVRKLSTILVEVERQLTECKQSNTVHWCSSRQWTDVRRPLCVANESREPEVCGALPLSPTENSLGSIGEGCEQILRTMARCRDFGALRSLLACEMVSTQFHHASRQLASSLAKLCGHIKIPSDVHEDVRVFGDQISRASFQPSESDRSASASIRGQVFTMQRHGVDVETIHHVVKSFLVSLDAGAGRNNGIGVEIMEEKEALKADCTNLHNVDDAKEVFLLRTIIAVLEAEQQTQVGTRFESSSSTTEASSLEGTQIEAWRWHVPFTTTISVLLVLGVCALWAKSNMSRSMEDGNWLRAIHLAFLPIVIFFMIFSCYTLINSIVSGLGTIAHLKVSNFFHRLQGGDCTIYVNDDGLMLISAEDRENRIAFYDSHEIAYCARPPHQPNVYSRRGRFKKASNMNFCLEVSQSVERCQESSNIDHHTALDIVLQERGHEFLAGGDVRIGEFILLVDSDTRVPEDCIAPTVTELMKEEQVAFTQHSTTPMQVVNDYWENAISHFTVAVYNIAIRLACSGGDVAPLVGHNAFLRWSAMKECAFLDPYDKAVKMWSENHVSEDFDFSLRLQVKGYHGRYITYTGKGFQEGVSLTVHDEITRLRKYSFGSAELLFNPLHKWYEGPISSLYWSFLFSDAPWWSKITITSYMGSYFAISSAWWLAILHYFMFSWSEYWRNEVVTAVDISATVFLVFSIAAPFSAALLRYRLGMDSLLHAIFVEFKHVPTFIIFFNGLSFHLFVSILSHIFQFDMQFGTTSKEVTKKNFFQELAYTVSVYRWCYTLMTLLSGTVVGFYFAPPPWRIRTSYSIVPLGIVILGHFFAPIVLNPVLMRVKF